MSSVLNLFTSKKVPFTPSERELIVSLVSERPIIEDKRTHAKNIELKKKAWEELKIKFNSQPFVTKRTTLQLKRCWENIKTLRKKDGGLLKFTNIKLISDCNSTSSNKLTEEVETKQSRLSIEQEQALHELRLQREKILVEREINMLVYETEIHELQMEKLKLEIDLLRKNVYQ